MGIGEHHHFSAGRLQRYLLRKALLHRMSKRARDDAAGASGDAPIGGDKTDIALSVDETKENWLKEEAQRTESAAADELKKKLEKARNKRELNKKSKKKSIAQEARDAGEEMSAADWVRHNKQVVDARAAEAQLKADMFDEADEEAAYEASDLSGLKVAHQTSELKDGSTVILTLKDESILEGTGDQINLKKYEDELENVNLKDMQ